MEWHQKRKKSIISEKVVLMKKESNGSNRYSGEFNLINYHWKRRSTFDEIHPSINSNRWNSLRSLKEDDSEHKVNFVKNCKIVNNFIIIQNDICFLFIGATFTCRISIKCTTRKYSKKGQHIKAWKNSQISHRSSFFLEFSKLEDASRVW